MEGVPFGFCLVRNTHNFTPFLSKRRFCLLHSLVLISVLLQNLLVSFGPEQRATLSLSATFNTLNFGFFFAESLVQLVQPQRGRAVLLPVQQLRRAGLLRRQLRQWPEGVPSESRARWK